MVLVEIYCLISDIIFYYPDIVPPDHTRYNHTYTQPSFGSQTCGTYSFDLRIMFGKSSKEKPAAETASDRSLDGSQNAIENVEGNLTSVRLLTTVMALVLSIFLVSPLLVYRR
jgi:hypothetical protein